ncbi:unnamed protein product [Urochloa humidicola]
MATESPASVAAEYDPKTDPKRRPANAKDPGWEFGYWEDPSDRDKVTCKLCNKRVPGGIRRFKQHLAGGYGDVLLCPRSTTELRKRMKDYLDNNKRRRPLFLDDENQEEEGEDDEVVEVQQEEASGAATAQSQVAKVPSSGTAAKRRQSTLQFKAATATKGKSKTKPNENNKSIVQKFRRTPEEVVDERHSGGRFQKTIQNSMKTKEETHYVHLQWALFFYEAGIPFHAATLRQFEVALEATAQYGSGYEPPSEYMFREPLLLLLCTTYCLIDHAH